ncbi:coronafacic acid synthetase [Lonsdalea britannica]|uniref:Coronafacic acid synthetase n=1 Tax=Lonsdalea britannica TaxID=1082704 RepID=A0AAD0WKS0_9GAMM|nr:coronafacic acid synthetase [Lonsdalea britannica]AXW87067.1 coronafacic acid synthetase [Lonsdalea britannica]OSN03706.1 coronafacic acid synthetase [Lonsdalea britannica]
MNEQDVIATCGLPAVGFGRAVAEDLAAMKTGRKASLYADPLAWLVYDAVELALEEDREAICAAKRTVGHIAISDQCTAHTLREIGAVIASGRISPLRFSGACPGLVCALPGQFLGFNGPSMVLSMPAEQGLPAAAAIAKTWLSEHAASHVIVTCHEADAAGHTVTSVIFTHQDEGGTY